MDEKFLKPYNPQETESRIYKHWIESGFFNPDICVKRGVTKADAEAFTIMMPPPNVTGVLHMGHGLMLTVEDILVRYKRMRGFKTLWLPGTDHAAIATQTKVEKDLKKEDKNRHDLGREEFLKRVEKFASESHNTIVSQIKVLGASCDWSREAYTLDEKRSLAVRTVFKKMYDEGLIYRGFRVVNWDPKGQTTVSDDEVEHTETNGKLYTFRYSKDFPIPIATTRPETKVGDTAVAVHPDDTRYKEFIGKEFKLEFIGVPLTIKVVADKEVDPEFGTGAVGVTPAHSMTDFEISKRHNLPLIQVINEYARMTVDTPELKDKKTLEAREIIVERLKKEGLLLKEEEIAISLSIAERSGGTIEPLPKLQWFVAVDKEFTQPHFSGTKNGAREKKITLKKIMHTAVETSAVKIIPDYFDKTYFHWIDNLKDWCISRQIWFGHRIPVWYHDTCQLLHTKGGKEQKGGSAWHLPAIVGEIKKDKDGLIWCQNCKNGYDSFEHFSQDPDTLDTWFSSSLWTFSTLGWPEETNDLKIYHPTNVLETGYEILFFWVARMILMTGYVLGDIPFHTVYLHGTVRDEKGRKMSKSLGNGIDPLDVAQRFGADAGRMTLIVGNTPGTDMRISEEKIRGYKNFVNKIWNATRFVLSNIEGADFSKAPPLKAEDKKHLEELDALTEDVTKDLEEYRFYMAGEKLYHYFWHTFADVIIEESKKTLQEGNEEAKQSVQWTLMVILATAVKLLHPFIPFVTEEIWSSLPKGTYKKSELLMTEHWPSKN